MRGFCREGFFAAAFGKYSRLDLVLIFVMTWYASDVVEVEQSSSKTKTEDEAEAASKMKAATTEKAVRCTSVSTKPAKTPLHRQREPATTRGCEGAGAAMKVEVKIEISCRGGIRQ